MSKVFRRPMFRRGGSTNMNGIMSGIRDEYEDGGPTARERYEEIVQKYSQPAIDPLSKLLIQGGLRGLSETGGGGTLANLAMAFQEPTEQLFSDLQTRKNLEREAELAGLQMDISDEERQARIAREDLIRKENEKFQEKLLETKLDAEERMLDKKLDAGGDEELKRRTDKYFATYNDYILAENRARHDVDNVPGQIRSKFGKEQYGGLLEGGDINKQAQKLGKKDNEGKVYYDITDGKTKRLRKDAQTGKFVWEEVSITGEIEEGVGQPGPEDTETNNVKIEEKKIKPKPFGKKEYEESIQKGTDYIMTPRDPESFDISNIRSFRKDF
jgi:hypothetical protein